MSHYAELHFDPQPDITAYELAMVFKFAFTECNFGTGIPFPIKAITAGDLDALNDLLDEKYPRVRRHFSVVCDGED